MITVDSETPIKPGDKFTLSALGETWEYIAKDGDTYEDVAKFFNEFLPVDGPISVMPASPS